MSKQLNPHDPQWPKITDPWHLPTTSPDGRYTYSYDVTNYNPNDPESTLGITITDTAKLMERLRHNISEGGDVGSEIGLDVTN